MRETYDAIIVGGGLAGLSTAGFLGRAGRRVLVVERREEFGGYAAQFTRGDYRFDPAIHLIGQGEGLLLSKTLRYLEVRDEVDFIDTGSFYETVFPDLTLRVPANAEGYIETHAELFPDEREGLRRFVALAGQIHREVHQLPPHLSLRELEEALARFPTLFRYRSSTMQDVLDEFFTDERLKALLAAWWPYFGLPPSKLSFFTISTPLTSFLNDGTFHCAGGTQKLVDALVHAVELSGGELLAGNAVERILVQDGRATGVALADGTVIAGSQVISAMDARTTFESLVGHEHLPARFVKRFQRLKPSLSAVVVFAATRLDLHAAGVAHSTFVNDDWSLDANHAAVLEHRPGGHWLSIPTLIDDTLAPAGEHLLIFTSLAPYDAVRDPQEREAYADRLLAGYERVIPGLRANLTFLETATPRTLERYSGNSYGAVYGWENTPAQAGTRRLGHVTPIQGLFLSGHWTRPGHSTFRVIFSGVETAMTVLGGEFADRFLRGLQLAA
jgi:prolycopene isomerase